MEKTYYDSLQLKIKSAKYHHDQVIALHSSNFRGILQKEDVYIAFISEFTAAMQTLHTCLDVLAQWINSRTLKLHENNVSFHKIAKKIKDPDTKERLNKLKETSIYLDDFVNTVKHKNIINVTDKWFFISVNLPMQVIFIDAFSRNERTYREKNLIITLKQTYEEVTTIIKEIIESHC